MRLALLAILLACFAPSLHARAFICLDYERYCTHHFWNEKGKRLSAHNDFRNDETDVFATYCVSPNDTLSLWASYTAIDEAVNGDVSGLGDVEIGWRRLLLERCCGTLSGQVVGIVPVGKYKPALRYGRLGGEANLLYTQQFTQWEKYGFYCAKLGYRYYSGFPSDQIRADLAAGYQVLPRLRLIATARLEYGLFNGHSRLDESNIAFNPNYRLLKTKIFGVIHLYKEWYASLGYSRHLWGRNVGIGESWFGGTNVTF